MKLSRLFKKVTSAFVTASMLVALAPNILWNTKPVKAADPLEDPDLVIIAIDPGHSGSDVGATCPALGTTQNYSEQLCNWRIAMACKEYLEQYEHVQIVVTRKDYEGVTLNQRVKRIFEAGANLSVSFHCNAATVSTSSGCEVYYSLVEPYKSNTYQLSKDICAGLSQTFGLKNRGARTWESNTTPGTDYLALVGGPVKKGIPGILIEHAFVSNPYDASLLTNDEVLKQMGQVDAIAIAKYFALTPKPGTNAIDMSGYESMKIDTRGTPANAPEGTLVAYGVHRQTYGWEQLEAYDGLTSGTVGESKRLEAIKIRNNTNIEGSVEYQVHCQTYGWMDWVSDGQVAGTHGEAKRLEGIRIRLKGELANKYDVYYRVHAQTYGWLDWAKNGQVAGTAGFAKRLEAIEIKFVEKGEEAPGEVARPYVSPNLAYRTHVQTYGWQNNVYDGATSGTFGQSKRLESISITNLVDLPGDIEYRVHVQTYGWQGWKKNGAYAGTVGQGKRLEAIQIRLTGELEEKYDVYYRVHAQTFGWLDWAKNGEPAGTAGYAKRLEAIQIVYVEKGELPPGATVRPYIGSPVAK